MVPSAPEHVRLSTMAPLSAARSVLAGYSQILLSRSWGVGLILLGATAVVPRIFFWGLFGVVLAQGRDHEEGLLRCHVLAEGSEKGFAEV